MRHRRPPGPVDPATANPGTGHFCLFVDDLDRLYRELSAKGVTFLQEPSERPYGVEAVMRDNTGNWLVLVEPRQFTPEDFA